MQRNKDERARQCRPPASRRVRESRVSAWLRFPADQVLLLDEKREYEVRRDDIFKLINLPMWQAIPLAAPIEARRGG